MNMAVPMPLVPIWRALDTQCSQGRNGRAHPELPYWIALSNTIIMIAQNQSEKWVAALFMSIQLSRLPDSELT